MKRSDVRDWLHQAALDVARLAEPRPAGRPEHRASFTRAARDSLLEAERQERTLATPAGVAHVVVDVRDEHDPRIAATFVVRPEQAVDHIPRCRQVDPQDDRTAVRLETTEHAINDALRLAHRALRTFDQGHAQAMHDLLRDLRRALRHAHALVTGPDGGASRPLSGVLTTQSGGAS